METTMLRQFLKGLCDNSCWDYAVFWKLRHQIPKVLSWQEGYYYQPKPRTVIENSSGMTYFDGSSATSFFDDEADLIYGITRQHPIELLMADMSGQEYTLGEGPVGKAACTYNYYWISLENISTSQFKFDKPVEFPEEWLPQLLAGIKTILLVSAHPHGVLQLGSYEEVPENAAYVDHIKERFIAHHVCSGFATPEEDHPLNSSSSSSGNIDEPSLISTAEIEMQKREESPVESEEATESNTLIFSSLPEIFEDSVDNKDLIHSTLGLSGMSVPLNMPLEMSQSNEELAVSYIQGGLPGYSDTAVDPYGTEYITFQPSWDDNDDAGYTCDTLSGIFGFPMDCDLFEALGPFIHSLKSEFPDHEAVGMSEIRDFYDGVETSHWELSECDAKAEPEDLLEALTGNFCDGLDGNSSNSSRTLPPSAAPTVQHDPTPSSKFIGDSDNSVLWSNTEAKFAVGNGSLHTRSTTSPSNLSCLTDSKEQLREGPKHQQLSGTKRKGKAGDGKRQRPRDRQLIQDRVKELRALVPNGGAKCSIDALLDRTVKHMVFLKSITNQAEKLRKCVPPKEVRPKLWKSVGIDEENCKKRRGRPFDFRGKLQVFPIVVEDLEYPGQMLIEMMCNDQGLFLEIAQVLRRLELTILNLKGVMETDSETTRARFIVEASKGFERAEIFWPLMQVLHAERKVRVGHRIRTTRR